MKFPGETDIEERPHDACPIFGVTYSFDLSEKTALQVELLYFREIITIYQYIGTIKNDYLEIPFLFKFKSRSNKKNKSNLFLGPILALHFHKERGGRSGNYDKEKYIGATCGMSFDIEMKSGVLVFDARCNIALLKTWGGELFMGSKIGFAFTVGYRFGRH